MLKIYPVDVAVKEASEKACKSFEEAYKIQAEAEKKTEDDYKRIEELFGPFNGLIPKSVEEEAAAPAPSEILAPLLQIHKYEKAVAMFTDWMAVEMEKKIGKMMAKLVVVKLFKASGKVSYDENSTLVATNATQQESTTERGQRDVLAGVVAILGELRTSGGEFDVGDRVKIPGGSTGTIASIFDDGSIQVRLDGDAMASLTKLE